MPDLNLVQLGLIALIFAWSGFVRSGLGFGGALFTLPFLLLVVNDPLLFLPIISVHLLFFSSITLIGEQLRKVDNTAGTHGIQSQINWGFIRYSMSIMLIPKIIGVVGLLVLPAELMNRVIFVLIGGYALTYIVNKPMRSSSRIMDTVFLALGGYISGTSLIGAPLIMAVAMRYLQPNQFRSTLFVIWFVLVSIKMFAFAMAGVNLQLWNALLLLPFAGIGHFVGLKAHKRLIEEGTGSFYRLIGWVLFATSCMGLWQSL